jgi:hypothetical protein
MSKNINALEQNSPKHLQALSHSKEKTTRKTSHLHTIYTCTYGILFFGTPHNGSSEARLLGTLQKLASTTIARRKLQTDSELIKALREESETLQNINDYFVNMMKRFRIHLFWENLPTNLKSTKDYIVTKESASPSGWPDAERAGIAADHSRMVKFESESAQGFRLVVDALDRYCEEAPDVVKKRCEETRQRLDQEWQIDAMEQLGGLRPIVPAPATILLGQQAQAPAMIQSREQFEEYLAASGMDRLLGLRYSQHA